jgi:hypothetical protein
LHDNGGLFQAKIGHIGGLLGDYLVALALDQAVQDLIHSALVGLGAHRLGERPALVGILGKLDHLLAAANRHRFDGVFLELKDALRCLFRRFALLTTFDFVPVVIATQEGSYDDETQRSLPAHPLCLLHM